MTATHLENSLPAPVNPFQDKTDTPEVWRFSINWTDVGIIPINTDSETLLSQLEHADRYLPFIESMTEKRKCEWLTVRTLLKTLTGEEKKIAYHPNGKPFLSDRSYHISISHTNHRATVQQPPNGGLSGYAAVAVNAEKEIAIDIEMISSRVLRIKNRFLSTKEIGAIAADAEIVHLLLHWSAKETVFKILDAGNINYQTGIHIRPFRPAVGKWDSLEACDMRREKGKHTVFPVRYFVGKNYVLTGIF
jgi:phosphopantetheinyl transferase